MGNSLSTTSERLSCLQLNDLPRATVQHMLSFLGGGSALCFALAGLRCLEATEAAFSGSVPPASGEYLRSIPGLFIYAVYNLKLSFNEAWMNRAAEWGLMHEMKVLRTLDPPSPWGKETSRLAVVHGHLDVLLWLRSKAPRCPLDFTKCLPEAKHHAGVRSYLTKGLELLKAVEQWDQKRALELIADGADVDTLCSYSGVTYYRPTPLGHALECDISAGQLFDVTKALLVNGADLHPSGGENILETATGTGHLESIKLLVAHGADLRDCYPFTSLLAEAQGQTEECVKYLISVGADVNDVDPDLEKSVLTDACSKGMGPLAIWLVVEGGAHVFDEWGQSPLWHACNNGLRSVAELLIAKGARTTATFTQDRWVPGVPRVYKSVLTVACEKGLSKVAKMLIANGALDAVGEGIIDAPLAAATARGFTDVVELLEAER